MEAFVMLNERVGNCIEGNIRERSEDDEEFIVTESYHEFIRMLAEIQWKIDEFNSYSEF